jgi:hypothetical protein
MKCTANLYEVKSGLLFQHHFFCPLVAGFLPVANVHCFHPHTLPDESGEKNRVKVPVLAP